MRVFRFGVLCACTYAACPRRQPSKTLLDTAHAMEQRFFPRVKYYTSKGASDCRSLADFVHTTLQETALRRENKRKGCRHLQSGEEAFVAELDVRSRLQENLDDLDAAVLGGDEEGPTAVAALELETDPPLDQLGRDRRAADLACTAVFYSTGQQYSVVGIVPGLEQNRGIGAGQTSSRHERGGAVARWVLLQQYNRMTMATNLAHGIANDKLRGQGWRNGKERSETRISPCLG